MFLSPCFDLYSTSRQIDPERTVLVRPPKPCIQLCVTGQHIGFRVAELIAVTDRNHRIGRSDRCQKGRR